MWKFKTKPACFLLGGFFIALTQGCSSISLQSESLLEKKPAEFIRPIEITRINFNPQREYECGPASLATILQWQGLDISDNKLVPEIYLPKRKGSLQIEMLATTRRYGFVPYVIEKSMTALLKEIKAGNPVLVLQNLGLESYPKWHYAVVIGYDLNKDEIILRSGEIKRHVNSFSLFERTWRRAKYWGFIALAKDKLPASGDAFSYLKSVAPFEKLKKTRFALSAYKTALQRWPDNRNLLMAAGNASYSINNLSVAEGYYRKVILKWPNYPPALNNLAQVLAEKENFHEAEKLILRIISLNDKYKKQYEDTLKNIRAGMRKK